MKGDLISRSALLDALTTEEWAAILGNSIVRFLKAKTLIEKIPAVDAETVIKSLPYVKEALEMAKQSLEPVVRCIDCRYSKTCNRTIELIPRQAQIGYLRCVVHSCEYGERRADDATD